MWPASSGLPLAVALCGPLVVIPSIYTRDTVSFSKSGANTKRCRQAAKFSRREPSSSPTAAAPPTTPPSSRSARPTSTSAPPSSARAPPLLPWTAAAPLSAVAPPIDDLLPKRHRPSSLPGWHPPPRRPLPQRLARNRRRRLRRHRRPRSPPTPHLLTARHAWRPGMGPAV
jgi:hypothetical protein